MAKKTNLQVQKELDEEKWVDSEKAKTDLSGAMDYCDYCSKQYIGGCSAIQLDRVMDCLCAKAYNRSRKK